ncbi:uncharacterized protein LOC101893610 isoform X1 [Musca domestica]|uniref:Uncharacterized protein LOC101893610 isoform X1 n=1 Tax=Musca domestica TaxID=7370 RepID=A0A9J7D323_MUSDO|nr:uncharacterized protein LOC101893610 isoform X1 [Musca domestica]
MGCASSTPMVQTAGSEILKAATHVAEDATKTAEEAVQGVKQTVGKTLETAKETVSTKVEEVKHEVETTLKEKVHDLDDAKNSLLGKLNLNPNAAAKPHDDIEATAEATKQEALKTTEKELKKLSDTEAIAKTTDMTGMKRTDTETDSLRTSTPESEIERALANTKAQNGEDDEDNPPTPKPTISELENLSHEVMQKKPSVNDIVHSANDPPNVTPADTLSSALQTSNTITSLPSNTTDINNSSAMHLTPLPIASATSIATAIAASTASALQLNQTDGGTIPEHSQGTAKEATIDQAALAQKAKLAKRNERIAAEKARQQKLVRKLLEEKRPGTTEWEKYADMLAKFRKFNPQDALRRGGTLTKFNGYGGHVGAAPIREKPLHGRHDDDSSDTNSGWGRKSPTRRSSARHGRSVIRQTHHRPTSASQRNVNGSSTRRGSGRKFDYNPQRSRVHERGTSSVSSYHNLAYNPSKVHANAYRLSPSSGTQTPTHAHASVKSHSEMRSKHSSVGSNNFQLVLEPLWQLQYEQPYEMKSKQPQTQSMQLLAGGSSMPSDAMHYSPPPPTPSLDNSSLTRESSTTSLSSLAKYPGQIRSYRSSLELRMPQQADHLGSHQPQPHPPVRNTSSFLSTPRSSPFGITKSYTDLYFASNLKKESETFGQRDMRLIARQRSARDKSPSKVREHCEFCSRIYCVKT